MAVIIKKKEKSWDLDLTRQIEIFIERLDNKIEEEEKTFKACEKITKLEIKLAQEKELHLKLTEQLSKLTSSCLDLERVCAAFNLHLTISDNDRKRLENAKENYQVAKELTGIRWDFSAPPGVAKGYIKSTVRRVLEPFQLPATDAESLWAQVQLTATPYRPIKYE